MFGIDDAILAAGVSSIGSLVGGAISSGGASASNNQNAQLAREMAQFNAAEAAKNRDWQERMSNTAYQRAMADMKTAGLNPILAYQQGGAGTPGGASASGSAAHLDNAMQGLGHGVTSAGQGAARALELQQLQSQTANNLTTSQLNEANKALAVASTAKTQADTVVSAKQAERTAAETALTMEQLDNPKAARALMGAQAHSAFQTGEVSRRTAEDASRFGTSTLGSNIGGALRVLGTVRNAVTSAYPKQQPSASPEAGWNRHFNPDGSLKR